MHTVVETPEYLAAAKRVRMSDDERDWVVWYISINPDAGVIVEDTGGARKVRVPRDRTGKSGGYRVVTYFMDENSPVFLLTLIDKTKEANLSAAGKKAAKKAAKGEKKRRR